MVDGARGLDKFAEYAKNVTKMENETLAAANKAEEPAGGPEKGRSTLLVIDDDPSFLRMARVLAEKKSVKVETASSAREAEALLRTRSYDLILSDYFMPDESGGELYVHFIQWRPELADRFVLMTGDGVTSEGMERFRSMGLRCISKVFFYEALEGFLVGGAGMCGAGQP